MKKILLFFALPFFMISCFSEAFSGEEDAQCGDGTFVCRQDAEGRTDSYLCHYDEDFERENLNLFEKCKEGCNSSTGKCRPWKDPDTNITWSSVADKRTYEEAIEYCENLEEGGYSDWTLPTINVWRTIVKNCPELEPDGECPVRDPDCLDFNCVYFYDGQGKSHDCECETKNEEDYYSKLGDSIKANLWSSSPASAFQWVDESSSAWHFFNYKNSVSIYPSLQSSKLNLRCVR